MVPPQSRSERVDRLAQARREVSNFKAQKALDSITALRLDGEKVTHAAVARHAGVSSWFTYNTPAVREAIQEAAQMQEGAPREVPQGPTVETLSRDVEELKAGVREVTETTHVLFGEVEALKVRVAPQGVERKTIAKAAALRYPGAKWSLAEKISSYFPKHFHYVEPYFGSGAVFFSKDPSPHEVLNDLDGRVVNFWKVLRDQTEELCWALETTPWSRDEYDHSDEVAGDNLEDARRFVVRVWQAHASDLAKKTGWKNRGAHQRAGGMSHRWQKVPDQLRNMAWRLSDAEIENRDALSVIRRFNRDDVLIYADPPYTLDSRTQKMYAKEVDVAHHVELLKLLDAHQGPVVLSGYANDLYDTTLAHWDRVVMKAPKVEKGASRAEVLWIKQKE